MNSLSIRSVLLIPDSSVDCVSEYWKCGQFGLFATWKPYFTMSAAMVSASKNETHLLYLEGMMLLCEKNIVIREWLHLAHSRSESGRFATG